MTQQLHELSDRDRGVLASVADLRLATGDHLHRLHFSGPDASSANPRIARRCLQRLHDHGLLWRAGRRVGGLRAGSGSIIYGPSFKGLQVLGRSGRGQHETPSLTFLQHQLAVAETYVSMHEALYAGRLAALAITTEPSCWRVIDDGSGRVLKPDLFVVATTMDTDHLAFVEVDNGTEHRAAIGRKLDLYDAYWQTGLEQADQGVFPVVLWQAREPTRRSELSGWLGSHVTSHLHRVEDPEGLINQLTKGGES